MLCHISDILASGILERLTGYCKANLINIRNLKKCLHNSVSCEDFSYLAHFRIFFTEIYDQKLILKIIRAYRNLFREKADSVLRYFPAS